MKYSCGFSMKYDIARVCTPLYCHSLKCTYHHSKYFILFYQNHFIWILAIFTKFHAICYKETTQRMPGNLCPWFISRNSNLLQVQRKPSGFYKKPSRFTSEKIILKLRTLFRKDLVKLWATVNEKRSTNFITYLLSSMQGGLINTTVLLQNSM